MKILVIGKGAREHAVASHLSRIGSHDLHSVPGNPGIGQLAQLHHNVNPNNREQVATLAKRIHADLVFIGPEEPLCAGVADELRKQGIPVVGPSQAASQVEASKRFGKLVCQRAGVPTPLWTKCKDYGEGKKFLYDHDFDVVIKEDGLASGKGVKVTASRQEALGILRDYQFDGYFEAGKSLILEQRLEGREVSAHAFTDGQTVIHLPFSCDYKSLSDGDVGPNTGGMGGYCRVPWLTQELASKIEIHITKRALMSLSLDFHHPFRGIFYPGVMITDDGPQVLEFNARFGDPEACVILALLETDLAEILQAISNRKLNEVKSKLVWSDQFAVAVVLASEGYPDNPITDRPIKGLEDVDRDIQIFHAGTKLVDGKLLTAGGRVLTLVATASSLEEARACVYDNVRRINFAGMHYRTDIAQLPN